MARPGQRQSGGTRTAQRPNRRREVDNDGLIPVLARAVREVEAAAQRGQVKPSSRTKFQVIALLMREERARVKVDKAISESERAEQMKRLFPRTTSASIKGAGHWLHSEKPEAFVSALRTFLLADR